MEKAASLVTGIVVISVTLIVGIFILSTMQTSSWTVTTASIANESITGLNSTVGDLLSKSTYQDVTCTVLSAINQTDSAAINVANITTVDCRVYAVADGGYDGENVNVSYSYTYNAANNITTAAGTAATALNTGTSWLAIVIVVGFAVIVLVILNKGIGSSANASGGEVYEPQAF